MQNIFHLMSKTFWSKINSRYSILFQIWNKKEYNIIISRVISSLIGSMYIETPYII